MSHSVREEINYWPGYVDALVNAVLNLLFLVGLFTIGLVTLNMEAIFTQEKVMRLQIESLFEGELNLERQQKALALIAERTHQSIPKPVVRAPQAPDVIHEVHIKAPPESVGIKNNLPADTVAQMVLSMSGGMEVLAQLTFEKNQFNWPENNAVVSQLAQDGKAHPVLLLVITDTTNPRLAHEAYTRLVAVRTTLLRNGVDPKNITLRAFSNPPALVRPTDMELSVFAVRVSP